MAGETEVLVENLSQRHFVHHKSHMTRPGFERRLIHNYNLHRDVWQLFSSVWLFGDSLFRYQQRWGDIPPVNSSCTITLLSPVSTTILKTEDDTNIKDCYLLECDTV
jgi:hypothetical protein